MANQKFDETKDKELWSRESEFSDGKGGYKIAVYSYDGGEAKIQITKFYMKDGQKQYKTMGRLNKAWANNIGGILLDFAQGKLTS